MEYEGSANRRVSEIYEYSCGTGDAAAAGTSLRRDEHGIAPRRWIDLRAIERFDQKVHLVDVKVVDLIGIIADRPLLERSGASDDGRRSFHRKSAAVDEEPGSVLGEGDRAPNGRRGWSKERWRTWKQKPIFGDFIEPARNALPKPGCSPMPVCANSTCC